MPPSEMVHLEDPRGYPERCFPTRVLPVDPSQIAFEDQVGSASSVESSDVSQVHIGHNLPPDSGNTSEPKLVVHDSASLEALQLASQAIRQGHLVAFPTETVYGLGASALSTASASKIFAAKRRPADNPLIVHVSSLEMMRTSRLVPDGWRMPAAYTCLANAFWPGPLTMLVPANVDVVPSAVTAGQKTVGVRMPLHPVARALISLSRHPIAAPSANASGRPSPTTAQHVLRDLGGGFDRGTGGSCGEKPPAAKAAVGGTGRLPYILDGGGCDLGVESTVIDGLTCADEIRVLRPGGVSVEAMRAALRKEGLLSHADVGLLPSSTSNGVAPVREGSVTVKVYGRDIARSSQEESKPSTPGMKYRHYSPDAKVVLLLPPGAHEGVVTTDVAQPVELQDAVREQVRATWLARSVQTHADAPKTPARTTRRSLARRLRVGLMCVEGSRLSEALDVPSASCPNPQTGPAESAPSALGTPSLRLAGDVEYELHPFSLGAPTQPELAARRLFAGLRLLDEGPLNWCAPPRDDVDADGDETAPATMEGGEGSGREGGGTEKSDEARAEMQGCDLILVEGMGDGGVGLAVMNRLRKAASETIAFRLDDAAKRNT